MDGHNTGANKITGPKDKDLQEITPVFEFEKFSIEDFQNDVELLIKRGNQAAEAMENEFPVDVFPLLFQDLIKECNKSLNFPTDYTGTAIISAVSTAIGKSAKVKVKAGWYEFAAFYIAIIGNAGANKSHPLELAYKPFEDIDKAEIKAFEVEYKVYEDFQALNKRDKASQPPPKKPLLIKSILHNFTPEILCQRLTDNERGCTVVSEELATFLEGMNNYSKGDQSSV